MSTQIEQAAVMDAQNDAAIPEQPKPQSPMTRVENVAIERFEALCYRRQPETASVELLHIVNLLRAGAEFIGYSLGNPAQEALLYSRLAAAVSALFADPDFQLSEDGFRKLAVQHAAIEAIFETSVFETADHLVPALVTNPAERDPAKLRFDDNRAKAKFLLLYCLASPLGMALDDLFRDERVARLCLPLFLGMLSHTVVLNPAAHEQRERLLGLGPLFEHMDVDAGLLPALSDAFMYASYGVREDRHQIKRSFSRMLARSMARAASPVKLPKKRPRPDLAGGKPTVLLCLEHFSSFHAMYRCYAPSVAQLRGRFRLVACIRASMLDDKARELFDDFLWLPEGDVILSDLVRRIAERAPDAIYYPSIGMALWWVALCQMRLAPLQIMTLGHPATTGGTEIDYVIADGGSADDATLFTERVVRLPVQSYEFARRDDTPWSKEREPIRLNPDPIIVAVPAMVAKLNVPFLRTLRRIKERAARKVIYHFFPNQIGLWHWQARKALLRWFDDAVVYPRTDYPTYLARLANCDLHFSAFPFGNTNGNIDSMLVGLPLLVKTGPEPHESYDGLMLEAIGLRDWIAESAEDYETLALLLVNYDAERIAAAEAVRAADIMGTFFGPRRGPAAGAFGRAFWYLYERHEALQGRSDPIEWTEFTPDGSDAREGPSS